MTKEREKRYRPNVAAILVDSDACILIGERSDVEGAWQFPQGGVHRGETCEQALVRELQEELGVGPEHYTPGRSKGPYRYDFIPGRKKEGFDGQEQTYFLVDFHGDKSLLNPGTEHAEFSRLRWIRPEDFKMEWLPPMKLEVYRQVFRDFFCVNLDKSQNSC